MTQTKAEGNTMGLFDITRTRVTGIVGAVLVAACTTVPKVEDKPVVATVAPTTPVAPVPEKPKPPPEPTASERLAKAQAFSAKKDHSSALAEARKVLDKEPKNVPALFLAAVSADQLGRFDEAVDLYRSTLAADPKHEEAVLNLGVVYKRRAQYDEAIALYAKVLEADPENVKVRNNLGVVQRLAKKYDDAEKTLRRVLARRPGNVDAYKNMVVLFMDQNKLQLAEQFSQEAKKLDEKDAGIWNNLGLIYFRKDGEKSARALAAFEKAVELDPSNAAARQNIAAIALRYRDYKTAEEHAAKAVELEPNSWENRLAYAYALEGGRKLKEAVGEYDTVLSMRGSNEDALTADIVWAKAKAYKATQEWSKAAENFGRYKSIKGNDKHLAELDGELQGVEYMMKLGNPPPQAPSIGGPEPTPEAPKQEAPAPAPTATPATEPAPAAAEAPAPAAAPAAAEAPAPTPAPEQGTAAATAPATGAGGP